MNLMEQHEEVVREIDGYYSFVFWVQFRYQWRLLELRLLVDYLRNLGLLPWRANSNALDRRRDMLSLLCNDAEKKSAYYDVCGSQYPTHALSEHLNGMFQEHDWAALEKVHRVRDDAIPSFGFTRHVLPYVMLVISIVTLVGERESVGWMALLTWTKSFSLGSLLDIPRGLLLLYLPAFVLAGVWSSWKARYRSRRAGDMFRYLAAEASVARSSGGAA